MFNRNFSGAAECFFSAIAADPFSIRTHRLYQDAMLAQGDSSRHALYEYYADLSAEHASDASFRYLLGRCQSCDRAVTHFNDAVAMSPCNTWVRTGLGACMFENGDIPGARLNFLKSIECDPDFEEAYRNLAETYAAEGSFSRAQKVYRKLLGRNKRSRTAWEWLGDLQLKQKKWEYARISYVKSTGLGASGPSIYFKLGYACFQNKDFAQACTAYKKSLECGGTTPELHYNTAAAMEQTQDFEGAIRHYTQAYEKNSDITALYSIGNCAVSLGLYSMAIGSYERFLKMEPENREATFGLANAYQLKKDFSRAIRLYEDILCRDSSFAKAYYNLGSIYAYHVKNTDASLKYWEMYVKKFPACEDAAFIRAEIKKIMNNR
jgi:tetratricopeptide (TPR) repeat protein